MKKLFWGTRTLASHLGVTRDQIRDMVSRREISPSRLKRNGVFYCVYNEKDQKKIREKIARKKKAA